MESIKVGEKGGRQLRLRAAYATVRRKVELTTDTVLPIVALRAPARESVAGN